MSLDACVQAPEFLPICQSAVVCDELLAVILLHVLWTCVWSVSFRRAAQSFQGVFLVGNYYSKSVLKVVDKVVNTIAVEDEKGTPPDWLTG